MKLTTNQLKKLIKEELNEMFHDQQRYDAEQPKGNEMDMTLDNTRHSALDELKNDKEALAALAMELNLPPGQLEMAVTSVLAGRGK